MAVEASIFLLGVDGDARKGGLWLVATCFRSTNLRAIAELLERFDRVGFRVWGLGLGFRV